MLGQRKITMPRCHWFVPFTLLCAVAGCQERDIPTTDSSTIDEKGTAHVTRVVPVPRTISPEAQKWLSQPRSDAPDNTSVADNRAHAEKWQETLAKDMQAMYPTTLTREAIAGVPVRIITPPGIPAEKQDRVLINVHGGGLQGGLGISRRDRSDCEPDENKSGGGVVPLVAGRRISCCRRRHRGRIQGTAQDL
ncbi:MAG: hypothetical protein HY010_13730 [Acidobacteria bacterium]|nr:hypothetical protein [Acidobacteriota bacterium]